MLKTIFFLAFLGAVILLLTSLNTVPAYKKDKPEVNYREYCAGCHGEKMNAFVDRKWKHGSASDDLFEAIKKGYPDEGMPSFDSTFSDPEIKELVSYIEKGIANVKRYEFKDTSKTSNIFKSSSLTVRLDTVASGINSPWGMAFLPNGDMLVTEKDGKFYRLTKSRSLQPIDGGPQVIAEGQGGLMDVELHPDFINNSIIYLSYSIPKKSGEDLLASTAIMKARLDNNSLKDQKVIFEALPYSKTRHHYGSRLEFGKDGYLYFSVGDRGNHDENPQNLDNHCGKIHRIKDDGSIPATNPFIKTPGAMPSIYSYGHRNPQGMVLHPETGIIWAHEHGPRGGDELNIIRQAKNYGWPAISYGINYNGTVLTPLSSKPGLEQPQLYWLPSIAPSGMAFVTGERYKPWRGHLLVGSLRFNYLNLCKLDGEKISGEEMLLKNIGRIRDVKMGPDGYIYVSVERPGAIFRLLVNEQ